MRTLSARWIIGILTVVIAPLSDFAPALRAHFEPAKQGVAKTQPFVDAPSWVRDQTIYEVNLRQFSEAGNVEGFQKQLPRLKELGVGVLWFMPIHPIGNEARNGSLGSPYAVKDFTAFNPEFGTLAQFKALVDEAHGMGMYVILDWVANHTAPDHPWVEQHPKWYTRNDKGQLVAPIPEWKDVVDLNFDEPDMRLAMIDAMAFWVREVGVDGFRCDAAEYVPLDFWVDARNALFRIKPLFMLAEGVKPELMDYAFDASYGWYLNPNMEGIIEGTKKVSDLISYLNADARVMPRHGFRMNFTTNHDKNSWEASAPEKFGKALDAFTVLTFTVPGMPLIYCGQEARLEQRLRFFDRDPITWRDDSAAELFRKLAKLKQDNRAIWHGVHGGPLGVIQEATNEFVLTFDRSIEGSRVVVMLNLGNERQQTAVPDEAKYLRQVLAEGALRDADGKMMLEPWAYCVWASVLK